MALNDRISSVTCRASSRVGTRISASFEDWQAESGGFTGAGLGLCDDIVCFFVVEQNGDREFLDRRRGFEAFRFNGFEGDIGQSERSEFF